MEVEFEKSAEFSNGKVVNISAEKASDISGENGVNVSMENGVKVSDEKTIDISGENGLKVSGEKSIDNSGENGFKVSGENGVKISEEKIDISNEKEVELSGCSSEQDEEISLTGNFLKHVYNIKRMRDASKNKASSDVKTDPKQSDVKTDPKQSDVKTDPKQSDVKTDPKQSDVKTDQKVNDIKTDPKGSYVKTDLKKSDVETDSRLSVEEVGTKESDAGTDPKQSAAETDTKPSDTETVSKASGAEMNTKEKAKDSVEAAQLVEFSVAPDGVGHFEREANDGEKIQEDGKVEDDAKPLLEVQGEDTEKQNAINSQTGLKAMDANLEESPCVDIQGTTDPKNFQVDEKNEEEVEEDEKTEEVIKEDEKNKEDVKDEKCEEEMNGLGITEEEKTSSDGNQDTKGLSNGVTNNDGSSNSDSQERGSNVGQESGNYPGTSNNVSQESEIAIFPATVQVICVSEEPDGNQAFSVCDGTGYSKTDAFLNTGPHVELFSVIRIVLVEYQVGSPKRSSRRRRLRRSKAGDLLGRESKFDGLLGIATFEVIENGSNIGHSLFCLQPPLISNFEKDRYEDQVVNGVEDFVNEDLNLDVLKVKFVFGDKTERFADKSVLIRQSSVFERHFSVPDSFQDQNVVQIVDAKTETFEKLLKFMEQKPFQVGRLQSVFDLLYLAEKYLVESLQAICRNAILEHLEHAPSSAIKILSLNKTNDLVLCSSVFKSIEENIHLHLRSPQFLLWDFDTLKTVISLKNLNIDEWRLLRFLYKWSMDNLEEIKSDSENIFSQLLGCIKLEEITKENLNSFLKFKDLDKLVDLEKFEIKIALMFLRKIQPQNCLLAPSSSFRDRNFHYNAKKSPRMFPVTVFSFDIELEETIQLPIVITGDDQTMIQVDINLKNLDSTQGAGDEADKMELHAKVAVVGSAKGLPDTSTFRVNDYTCHPSDFTADFSLHFVQFENGNPVWSSIKTPFRKKWMVTLDRSLMRTDVNGRRVFSADLVIGSYMRNFEDSLEDTDKIEEDMNSDFSSFVASDPESGTSLANHSANSDIFHTDSDSNESGYINNPDLGDYPEGNESPNQEEGEEEEEEDNSFIDDGDEAMESPRAASTSSRREAEDDSDNDSDIEQPKAKRRMHSDDSDVEPPKAKRKKGSARKGVKPGSRKEAEDSSDNDSDTELPKANRKMGSSRRQVEDDSDNDSDVEQPKTKRRMGSSGREAEDDSDNDSDVEQPKAKRRMGSSRKEAKDDSDNDSDVEQPKAKRRKMANRLNSDSSSESHYSTDPELGDSPNHEGINADDRDEVREEFNDDEGDDRNEEALEAAPDSHDEGDEFSDGNPGDLCFSPEECSDGPVFSAEEGDEDYEEEDNNENTEEAQFSP